MPFLQDQHWHSPSGGEVYILFPLYEGPLGFFQSREYGAL